MVIKLKHIFRIQIQHIDLFAKIVNKYFMIIYLTKLIILNIKFKIALIRIKMQQNVY